MDLDDLRCFLAAADADTFRKAARIVGLSPGAFSDRIKRLEEGLGCALFTRTTRQVHLTEEGLRLVAHARGVVRNAERCREVARGDVAPPPYELWLGTRFELGLSWLTPALDALEHAAPERTLHLYMGDTPALISRVERGELDAAVLSARLTSARIEYAVLHRETYRLVGHAPLPGAVADHTQALTLLDVSADLPLFRYLLDENPEAAQWAFRKQHYLGGIGAIRARVLAAAGVAVLPEYYVHDDLAAGRLVDLAPDLSIREDVFRLIWRKGHPLTQRLLALAEALRALPLR